MSLFVRSSVVVERRDADLSGFPSPLSVPTPLEDHAYYGTVTSLQVAAVVACVGLRAGALAQIPLKGYTTMRGRSKLLDVQPDLYADPSLNSAPSVWRIQMSISRDVWGWALGRIVARDAADYPVKAEWLDPTICRPKVVAGGSLEWRVNGRVVDNDDLLHVPSRWVLPGNPAGISPLEYSGLVDLARLAQRFGSDWFRNGAVPSAIIYSDQPLDKEGADGILSRIMEKWRQRKPAIVGAGLKYETVSVNANESQFLETCTKIAGDIAASFNLPAARIGAAIAGQSLTYQNIDQAQQQMLVDSINPDLVVIQETLDHHTRPGVFSRWSTGAFLRSDLLTRLRAYEIGIRSGVYVPDEPRNWEDLEPLPDGLGTLPVFARSNGNAQDLNANTNSNPDGMTEEGE